MVLWIRGKEQSLRTQRIETAISSIPFTYPQVLDLKCAAHDRLVIRSVSKQTVGTCLNHWIKLQVPDGDESKQGLPYEDFSSCSSACCGEGEEELEPRIQM